MAKSKMAPLKPSLREKKRYLAFEIMSKKPVGEFKKVSKALWQNFLSYLGILGVSKAGIWILPDKYNTKKQKGLIRVNRKEVDKVKASFVLMDKIDNTNIIVRSLGVSGILKKAESNYIKG